jgi:hypothetical protein
MSEGNCGKNQASQKAVEPERRIYILFCYLYFNTLLFHMVCVYIYKRKTWKGKMIKKCVKKKEREWHLLPVNIAGEYR